MRNAIYDRTDIRITNTNRFYRATSEHKDFPGAKCYMRNVSIDRVRKFFNAIGVEFALCKDRYNVTNIHGECIIIDVYEDVQERYIGYTLFV